MVNFNHKFIVSRMRWKSNIFLCTIFATNERVFIICSQCKIKFYLIIVYIKVIALQTCANCSVSEQNSSSLGRAHFATGSMDNPKNYNKLNT